MKKNIVKVAAVMAVLAGTAIYAQVSDKYSLKSPSGIAFSDFKGYEDPSGQPTRTLQPTAGSPAMSR